jgi:prephenate dehydrogenase
MWKKISILGPGLLGGSLALALRDANFCENLTLYGRRASSIAGAIEAGFGPRATTDLETAVAGAELVILATPIGVMAPLLDAALPALSPGTLITDVGSVKSPVVRQLTPLAAQAQCRFLGSHPMAGSEKAGFSAATPTLFEGAACIITPTAETAREDLDRLSGFWSGLGARISCMDPAAHDALVARISHLPHLVASLLMEVATTRSDGAAGPEALEFAGGGLRDTTRIAAGDVPMWTEILLSNRHAVTDAARDAAERLRALANLLENEQEQPLRDFLETARKHRLSMNPGNSSGE